MTKDSDTQKKRAILGGLLKLMFVVSLLAVLWVGFSFSGSGERSSSPSESKLVNLEAFAQGGAEVIEWEGRPVLVLKRSADMLRVLQKNHDLLLQDAYSEDSKQPVWAKSVYRSRTPQWFVVIGSGSDFGCPVEYLPSSDESFAGQLWPGGFKDTCRGSRYDLSGRVYAGQNAESNLEIPNYRIEENILHLGGL